MEFVGQGQSLQFTETTAEFIISSSSDLRELSVEIRPRDGSPAWSLHVAAPTGTALTVGRYQGATKWPFQSATRPGFDFSGDGRSCSLLAASFDIHEAQVSGGAFQRFRITFGQSCFSTTASVRGDLQIVR
jgi:hypothetical protein